jgi:hypothetical protein
MIFPSLTDAERAVLEEMVVHGPNRAVPTPTRGRLALYRLIDETPDGWKITPLGRQALQAAPAAATPAQPQKRDGRSGENERHYGKKTRDTSWFG